MSRTFFAPGRVNLIGEHTDYSGGLVLPAAIDRGVTLRAVPGRRIRLASAQVPGAVDLPADGAEPGADWGRYVAAVAAELAAVGRPPVGLEGELSSDLPAGAGLSSSAALEVVVATALCAVASFPLEPIPLAQLCQRAEQRAVGVPTGIMDQAASLLGRADAAVLLDCGTLYHRLVPLPPELALLIIDSGVRRTLEGSGYAQRRAELETGLAGRDPRGLAPADVAAADGVPARRIRHVVTENARVLAVEEALRRGDRQALGELFAAGHASLRDDFEVSIPELDLLVDLAVGHGAVAARMTGGGFGGAIVALVEVARAQEIGAAVTADYAERTGRTPTAYPCRASDGAHERG